MYYKIILNAFFITFIFILQLSFVSDLSWWFSMLNIILISLIFILVYFGFKITAFWSLGFGFLLDVYSFNYYGLYILSLFLTLLLVNFILVNFITNRSLYSFLVLIIVSLLCFQIILHSLAYFFSFFNEKYLAVFFKEFFWFNIVKQILINSALTVFIFYTFSFISNRFKPVFLIREKK